LSQLAAGNTLVVNATGPPLDVTVTGWAALGVPAVVFNVSDVGFNVSVLVVPVWACATAVSASRIGASPLVLGDNSLVNFQILQSRIRARYCSYC
jgi:hypothetical protein